MSGHAIRGGPGQVLGSRGRSDELHRALAVHVLMLPVYYFWAWVGFGAQELWGSYVVYGLMWLMVAGLMVHWSHRGRVHLVPRVLAWALASSVTVLVVLPLLWRPTRTLLVPPRGGVR